MHHILKNILNRKVKLLLVFAIVFCLQINASTAHVPSATQRSYSYVTAHKHSDIYGKNVEEKKEDLTTNVGVAFPSRNIILGILLIGIYVVFMRDNINSRKADF